MNSEPKEQVYSVSAISTPKNNILSKILKDKPLIKETLYANKPNKTAKNDSAIKGIVSSQTPSNNTSTLIQKVKPSTGSPAMNNLVGTQKTSKTDNEYVNSKINVIRCNFFRETSFPFKFVEVHRCNR